MRKKIAIWLSVIGGTLIVEGITVGLINKNSSPGLGIFFLGSILGGVCLLVLGLLVGNK
jgi:hypothetical protein